MAKKSQNPKNEHEPPVNNGTQEENKATDETVDLSDILAEETEVKVFTPPAGDEESETPQIESPKNNEDFEAEEPEPAVTDPPDEENTDGEPKNDYTPPTATESAKMLWGTLDLAGQMMWPMAYKRRMFTEEELEILPFIESIFIHVEKPGGESKFNLTDEEKAVLKKYRVYRVKCKGVAFTNEEKKLLVQPTAEMMEKHGWKPGPELNLTLAAFTVLGARVTALFD